MTEPFDFSIPVDIFEGLITPVISDYIVKEIVRYATTRKNIIDFTVSVDENLHWYIFFKLP